jgi:putative flippase GtrA
MTDALPLGKIIRFLVIGSGVTAIHIGLGFLFTRLLPDQSLTPALLAYLGAAVTSYVSQRVITFRSTTPHHLAIPRFALMVVIGVSISLAYAAVFTKLFGWDPMVAVIAASLTVPVVNYIAMDRIIFPDQK